MAHIREEEINAVRSKADIVDVVSHYISVEKQGNAYRAICPFHDDHDPSLHLNQDLQIYKCFVCGAGGNVFGFVQNYEKISFPEAVGKVAELIGVSISVKPDAPRRIQDPKKEEIYNVLQETIRYTMYELNSTSGQREKEYLHKRMLTDEIISLFEIGFNPTGDTLYRFLHAKGFSDRDVVRSNVGRMSTSGMHDVFSGRITFPIHDAYGNPVGFSARTLDPDNPSKYINTTQTEVYVKGNLVYNAHRAKEKARKEGKLYICEGVTDVIAFHRAGIENVVCTLGTACTVEQIRIMKRLAIRLVFCYDGDRAGQNATMKAIQLARSENCDVAVIDNQTGKDPDEILRQDGEEALRTLVSKEITWMEFYLHFEGNRTNMNSYQEKREFIQKAQKEISTLKDEFDQKYYTNLLSEMTGIQLEIVKNVDTPFKQKNSLKPVHIAVPEGIQKAEEQILMMMMKYPSACVVFEDQLGYLLGEQRQSLAVMILAMFHQYGKVDVQVLLDQTEDQEIKNLITALVTSSFYNLSFDEKMLEGAIRKVKRTYLENEANAYKQQLSSELNPQSKMLIMKQYTDCITRLRQYIDEEDTVNL